MKKRGISAIVATVLVILITVAGIAIIWVAILPMIKDQIEFSELSGRVSVVSTGGYTLYDADRGIASVQVKREPDEGVMDRVKISFLVDGNSVSSSVVAPESGGTKVYNFDLSGYGVPDSVGVAPIFSSGTKEKEGAVTSNVKLSSGTIGAVRGVVYDAGLDYVSEIPTDGLVSMWTFSGDASDGWGENGGSLVGDAQIVDGELVLDGGVGGADWVEIGNPSGTLNIPNDISISFWVADIISGIVVSGGTQYGVFATGGGGVSYWYWGATTGGWRSFGTGAGTIPTSGWNHIVLTNVPGNGNPLPKVYVNGVEQVVSGPTQEVNAGGVGVRIGEYSYTPYNPLEGRVDNVMIFNRVLSEEEVTAIYGAQGKG